MTIPVIPMPDWFINVAIAGIGVISTFSVMRSKIDTQAQQIESLFKINKALGAKVDKHSETLSGHNVMLNGSLTREAADNRFVSKELFHQLEKHMDENFGRLENGIDKIINTLEGKQ